MRFSIWRITAGVIFAPSVPLGLTYSDTAADLITGGGKALTDQIRLIGKEISAITQRAQTNRQVEAMAQEISGLDPMAADYMPKMLSLAARHPMAMQSEAGQSILSAATHAYQSAQTTKRMAQESIKQFGRGGLFDPKTGNVLREPMLPTNRPFAPKVVNGMIFDPNTKDWIKAPKEEDEIATWPVDEEGAHYNPDEPAEKYYRKRTPKGDEWTQQKPEKLKDYKWNEKRGMFYRTGADGKIEFKAGEDLGVPEPHEKSTKTGNISALKSRISTLRAGLGEIGRKLNDTDEWNNEKGEWKDKFGNPRSELITRKGEIETEIQKNEGELKKLDAPVTIGDAPMMPKGSGVTSGGPLFGGKDDAGGALGNAPLPPMLPDNFSPTTPNVPLPFEQMPLPEMMPTAPAGAKAWKSALQR